MSLMSLLSLVVLGTRIRIISNEFGIRKGGIGGKGDEVMK